MYNFYYNEKKRQEQIPEEEERIEIECLRTPIHGGNA